MNRLLIVASTVIALSLGSYAEAVDPRPVSSQRQIEESVDREQDEVRRKLRQLYQQYLDMFPDGADRDRLIKAQEAWKSYSDLQCEAVYGLYSGGTLAATQMAACKRRMAEARLWELRETYSEPPRPDTGEKR